ncbi:MAG TPA: CAP domain-containing protein [Steroidobacteraceae bacterium]|nr:CAP domain-containing protein [Steroidobacteraceae bacterium]
MSGALQARAHGAAASLDVLAMGCGVRAVEATRWQADRRLDAAAAQWARGSSLHEAVERSGFVASAVSGLHVEHLDATRPPVPGASTCRALRDDALRDTGRFERGDEAWIVLAAPVAVPAAGDEARVDARALELVNRARASSRRCGRRVFSPAAPLRLSARLTEAAAAHARDMARHGYFEHQDPEGNTPADRVRATGYAERRVGENIARGTLSTEDAIAGWLASPGHCENLMDPQFTDMGIAWARAPGALAEIYWVQVLAAPK